MKVTLFALFVALLIIGCAESPSDSTTLTQSTNPIDLDDSEVRKKIIAQAVEVTSERQADGTWVFYERHTRLPYKGTGWAVIYYDDGIRLEALIQLKGGKREGLLATWYKKGQMKVEVNFIDGKKDGLLNHSYMEMQKRTESNWMDDKMDGFSTTWHENGQKKAEANWKDSKRDGLSTEWHENGQKKSESNWKDGCADGLANTWHENGQKKAEVNWKDDKIVWLLSWHENGEKSAESNFKNGNGVLVWYKEDGTENYREVYKAGEIVRD